MAQLDSENFKFDYMKIVKIIKCSGSNYWYKSLIGEVFEVYDYGTTDYVLKDDKDHGFYAPWRHLYKSDCQILNEAIVERSEIEP